MANIGYSCIICSTDESSGWTHRAGYWLCSKCSQIPVAIFYDDGSVGVTIVGGSSDGENIVVPGHIIDYGYRVAVQDYPSSPKFHYVDYKFDWDLQFFVLRK